MAKRYKYPATSQFNRPMSSFDSIGSCPVPGSEASQEARYWNKTPTSGQQDTLRVLVAFSDLNKRLKLQLNNC